MKKLILIFTTVLFLLTTNIFYAQEKWSFEFRTGASHATKELGNTDLSTGFGFEGIAAYRFMPYLSAYAGWGWNQFSAENSFAGSDIDFEETGYTFGIQFIHPLGNSDIHYLVKIGGIYNHIETESNDGEIINDSGHGLGWQISAGLVIPITNQFSILQSLRYRALERDIKFGEVNFPVELNYLSAGFGFSYSF